MDCRIQGKVPKAAGAAAVSTLTRKEERAGTYLVFSELMVPNFGFGDDQRLRVLGSGRCCALCWEIFTSHVDKSKERSRGARSCVAGMIFLPTLRIKVSA